MSKPSPCKTPDWPYDMAAVIHDLTMRHRDPRRSVAVLAAALHDLGHNAYAKVRDAHTSTWMAAENADGRALCYTKQSQHHVVELDGKILTPWLTTSWRKLLREEHDRHRCGAENGKHDIETEFYGGASLLGEVLGTDEEVAAAVTAMEAHPNPDYNPNPQQISGGPLLSHIVHRRDNAENCAKSLCLALRDLGLQATIFEEVRRVEHQKFTEEVSVFFLEHGEDGREMLLTGAAEDAIGKCLSACSSGPHGEVRTSGFIDVKDDERENLKRWRRDVDPIAQVLFHQHLDSRIGKVPESPRLRM